MSSIQVSLPVPAGNGVGAGVDTSLLAAEKTIVVGGTFDASVTLEISVDAGVTWAGIATMTGAGEKRISFAAQQMRVRVDAYTSGTPTVEVGAEATTGNFSAINVPAADGNGTALNVSAYGWCNTLVMSGDPGSSTLNIQVSQDNVSWQTIASFSAPGYRVVKFSAQFVRVNRTTLGSAVAGTVSISIGATDSGSGGGGGDGFGYFGDGSDGSQTLVGNVSLQNDSYFENLDLAGFTLTTQGVRVFVNGTLTISAGSIIRANGNAGTPGADGAGISGGGVGPVRTLGNVGSGGGGDGSAGGAVPAYGAEVGADGGAGGAGDAGAGGAGGVATPIDPLTSETPRSLPCAVQMYAMDRVAGIQHLNGGAGGGGGNREVGVASGGGGGAGGGILMIAARTIVLAATGTVQANGGNGGIGAPGGNAGGGGGGGGGIVSLVYETLQDAGGTIEANGGIGGVATGTGVDGSDGDPGVVYQYQV